MLLLKSSARILPALRSRVVRHRRPLLIVLALLGVYGLLGNFLLPGIVKAKAEAALTEKLNRKVTIETVDVHPYALALTLGKVRIADRGAGDFLSIDTLYVNLSSASLLRLAPVISELAIYAPHANIVRDKDGGLNVADMMVDSAVRGGAQKKVFYAVSNIQIKNGRIDIDDRKKNSRHTLKDLNLGLPFISNMESAEEAWVQPHLSARLNDGAQLTLDGRARLFADKREMDLDINLNDLDLLGVDEYAPAAQGIKLLGGKLDSDVRLTFVQGKGMRPGIRMNGRINARNVALENQAGLPWRLNAAQTELRLDNFDPTMERASAAAVSASNIVLQQGKRTPMQIAMLNINGVRLDPKARTVSATLIASTGTESNAQGSIKANGHVGWAPLKGEIDVDVDKLDLTPFQGWLNKKFAVNLKHGLAKVTGKAVLSDAPRSVAFTGTGSLGQFVVQDEAGDTDLLRWKAIDLQGLVVTTAPLMVAIETMGVADFYGRAIISEEGKLNLRQLVKKTDPPPAPDPSVPEEARGELPFRIGQIVVTRGRLNLNDRFVKPNYRANVYDLVGKIGPLEPGKQGDLELRGTIDRSAPLHVVGKLDPFAAQAVLDMKATVKGIDLPTLSSYSSRYVGYEIEKGKLSVDLHYQLNNGQLTAENNIFLSQLTLGRKVEGPDAPSLPVNLAITLLKDSRGEINMRLPVSGTLNDPQFSVGDLMWQAVINLVGKAITSPFTLLGKAFGDGADLSYLDFVPGQSRLTPEAEKNLDTLVRAMKERTSLALDVTGVADPVIDGQGLRQATLEWRMKQQKAADMSETPEGGVGALVISPAEYPRYLKRVYDKESFDKPRNIIGIAKDLPVEEMQRLLIANMKVGESELRALAERRARAARDWLLEKGISHERVFLVRAKTQSNEKSPTAGVEFSLH